MEITIPVKKANAGLNVELNNLVADAEAFGALWASSPALRYVIEYGLRQSVNDAHAAMKATEPSKNILAVAQKKLDAIISGTIGQRVGRAVRERLFPDLPAAVEAKMFVIAANQVRKAIKAAGGDPKTMDEDAFEAVLVQTVEDNAEALRGPAEALVAADVAAKGMKLEIGLDGNDNEADEA